MDLVGHISLMLPKFETRIGMSKKKLTSWAHKQETKSGWMPITTILTTETSSYPTLGTVSLSPSTVLCTIEDSEIDIGNIESKWLLTKRLLTAATIGLGMLDTTPSITVRVKTPRAMLSGHEAPALGTSSAFGASWHLVHLLQFRCACGVKKP